MSTLENAFPLAAAISGHLRVLDAAESTNRLLRDEALADFETPHLTVLLTRDQRAGRGRLDRVWTAPAGTALAISVLLCLPEAPVDARGWVPLAAGLAVADAAGAQLPGHEVGVKWPNDVWADGRKLSGILCEVVSAEPFAVVVGAGINTTMTVPQLPVPTATSFAVLGASVDEDRLVADFLRELDRLTGALADPGAVALLRERITEHCVTIGREVTVSLPGDAALRGTATGLDAEGRLLVDDGAAVTAVGAGDVVHVR